MHFPSANSCCCGCSSAAISATASRSARASLSRESGLALSSATIRNIVADLEQLGFVSSPHTSAGRVPTDKGYRFFVDSLLKARAPIEDDPAFTELRRQLDASRDDSKALVAAASQLLSSVTHLAGVVTLPRTQQASISQIEFVGLVRQSGAGRAGVQRPRSAEPHHPARALSLRRRAAPRRQLPHRALPRQDADAGAPGHPARDARSARTHERRA